MELIFGVFKRDEKAKSLDLSKALKSFALDGKRSVSEHRTDRFFFSTVNVKGELDLKNLYIGLAPTESGGGGSYSRVQINEQAPSVKISSDEFGTRPLFYILRADYFIFCSEFEPLTKVDLSFSLNRQAVADYVTLGVTLKGETFFKEISILEMNSFLEVAEQKINVGDNPESKLKVDLDCDLKEHSKNINKLFNKSVADWVDHYSITAANLSGGADSRLILASIVKNLDVDMTFYTDESNYLDGSSDKDVLVAKELAEKFSFNHEVRKHQDNIKAQEGPFERRPSPEIGKLSGNHGGELLGGDSYNALKFIGRASFKKLEQRKRSIFLNYQEMANPKHRLADWSDATTFRTHCKFLFNSFFTDIYSGGGFGHWVMPSLFSARKLAPFWSNNLLNYLSKLEPGLLKNYKLYAEVYRSNYPKFKKVSFNSPLARIHDDFNEVEIGEEQKNAVPTVNYSELLKEKLSLLGELGFFNVKEVSRLLSQPKDAVVVKRLYNFTLWYDFYNS